jgi:hypothetical protein
LKIQGFTCRVLVAITRSGWKSCRGGARPQSSLPPILVAPPPILVAPQVKMRRHRGRSEGGGTDARDDVRRAEVFVCRRPPRARQRSVVPTICVASDHPRSHRVDALDLVAPPPVPRAPVGDGLVGAETSYIWRMDITDGGSRRHLGGGGSKRRGRACHGRRSRRGRRCHAAPRLGSSAGAGGVVEASRGEKCLREVHRRRHLHLAATEASSGARRMQGARRRERGGREEGERELERPEGPDWRPERGECRGSLPPSSKFVSDRVADSNG